MHIFIKSFYTRFVVLNAGCSTGEWQELSSSKEKQPSTSQYTTSSTPLQEDQFSPWIVLGTITIKPPQIRSDVPQPFTADSQQSDTANRQEPPSHTGSFWPLPGSSSEFTTSSNTGTGLPKNAHGSQSTTSSITSFNMPPTGEQDEYFGSGWLLRAHPMHVNKMDYNQDDYPGAEFSHRSQRDAQQDTPYDGALSTLGVHGAKRGHLNGDTGFANGAEPLAYSNILSSPPWILSAAPQTDSATLSAAQVSPPPVSKSNTLGTPLQSIKNETPNYNTTPSRDSSSLSSSKGITHPLNPLVVLLAASDTHTGNLHHFSPPALAHQRSNSVDLLTSSNYPTSNSPTLLGTAPTPYLPQNTLYSGSGPGTTNAAVRAKIAGQTSSGGWTASGNERDGKTQSQYKLLTQRLCCLFSVRKLSFV